MSAGWRALWVAAGGALALDASAAAALDPAADTAGLDAGLVRWVSGRSARSPSGWPADAPAVRFYFKPGDTAPSCGLLVAATKRLVPMVEPEAGDNYPQCTGVPAALVLQRGGQRFFLLRAQQRDTREDTSLTDLLFEDRGGQPVPLDELASPAAPTGKPLSQVAAWLRAGWALQAGAAQGAQPLPEHTATTPGAYLAVARSPAAGCRFSLGTPEAAAPALTLTQPCVAVLATSAFQQGAASWFVALFDAGAAGRRALALTVDAQGAREVAAWSEALSAPAQGGKIVPLRQALQKWAAGPSPATPAAPASAPLR